MPTPRQIPQTGTGNDNFQQDRLNQLMQQGYTGTVQQNGQNVQMVNGVIQSAPDPAAPAAPAGTAPPPSTGADPSAPGGVIGGSPSQTGPLGQWNGWAFAGGVNPGQWANTGGVDAANWQNLGGGANLGFLGDFQNILAGGANPTQVAPTDAQSLFNAGQSYADTAYQQATRQLDPQWQQQEAQFNQQMVNQGLAPGSEAYNTAKAQFDQAKNDAYAQARAQSQQQGLQAQGQGFGQGLAQSQLASGLAQALLGSQTGIANQQLGGNANITGQLLGGNQALMQALLGGNSNIAQQIIGGNATMNAANSSAGASRYAAGLNHDINQQQIDNSMLLSLLGLGQGVNSYNNGLITQDQNRNMAFFPYMPSGAGNGQIDVQSPYNNQYNGQMNAWNNANAQADAQNQQYAQYAMMMASLFASAREWKETEGPLEPMKALEAVRSLPVDRWRYKGQPELHVGTYAREFNKAIGVDEKPVINIINMLGTLMGAVKALDERFDKIEQRLSVAGVEHG